MGSKSKGDRWERNYRNAFNADRRDDPDHFIDRWEIDKVDVIPYFAIRLPSSGSAVVDDLPDLVVWADWRPWGGGLHTYAAEVKAFDERTRLPNDEIDALKAFAKATGSRPIVIAHADYVGDRVFRLVDLHSTDKGYTIVDDRDFGQVTTFATFVKNEGTP